MSFPKLWPSWKHEKLWSFEWWLDSKLNTSDRPLHSRDQHKCKWLATFLTAAKKNTVKKEHFVSRKCNRTFAKSVLRIISSYIIIWRCSCFSFRVLIFIFDFFLPMIWLFCENYFWRTPCSTAVDPRSKTLWLRL